MDNKEPMYFLRQDTDPADRPHKIYLEPTSLCNLHCSICFRHGWIGEQTGHMAWNTFLRIAKDLPMMPSVEEVFFGGMGEPLFHPDICRMIAALPKTKKISLLTNGTMLTAEKSHALIEAGLDELWVSMDGFEAQIYESIQLGSRFATICQNLRDFNDARKGTTVRLCLTFVVTPENVEQLRYINAFADRYHVDELNISHMIPGAPVKAEEMLYDRTDIPVGKMKRFVPEVQPVEEHVCPFVANGAMFVRWDGNVVPCMQLLHSCHTYLYEEQRTVTSFSYGNVGERFLLECWDDPGYRDFRERVRIFYFPFCTICWGCEDRKENLTDCVYGEGPTCGACLWATGKIFCP